MRGRHLHGGREEAKQPRKEPKWSLCGGSGSVNRAPYVVQMHGRRRHHHQRGKGHKAAHKNDLRQPKRARICATDCRSPHQTSVPVSCGRSPQLVSHVIASVVYASMPGIRQELKPSRTRTKQNTTPNTHQRQNPRRSRHAAYDKRLGQLLSVDMYKKISVSKGHPTGLD